MKEKYSKIIRYSITLVLLLILVYFAEIGAIINRLSNTDLVLYGFAVSVFLSIYIWSALRWKSLLSGLDYSLSFIESIKIIAMSYGFNKLLPLNSGDLSRSKLMERYTDVDSHGRILGAVAMERFLDVLLLGVLTASSLFYILGGLKGFIWLFVATGFLITLLVGVRFRKKYFIRIIDFSKKFRIPKKLRGLVKDGIKGFSDIPLSNMSEIMFWHGLRWFAGIMVLYILSMSLGTPISLAGATFVTGVMSLVAALPITPAGVGPVEALGTGSLIIVGLSSGDAAALVVLQRSLGFILMGGIGALAYSFD